jgi:Flp pilus assembly protein TadG
MMSPKSHFLSHVTRLLHDRSGNFAIMSAILAPIVIGAAGFAIDLTTLAASRRQLQEASDSAALAAATALANGKVTTDAQAQQLAKDFIAGQMAANVSNDSAAIAAMKDAAKIVITTTPNGVKSNIYSVSVSANYQVQLSGLGRLVGFTNKTVAATSSAVNGQVDSQGGLSMYLVLDRSGSMSFITDTIKSQTDKCQNYTSDNWREYPNLKSSKPCYVRKVEALQSAAAGMFTALNDADSSPNHDLIRMGAVSYTDEMQTPKAVAWGTTAASDYVNALPTLPTGGTDASKALQTAYDALKSSTNGTDTETVAHKSKNHTGFTRSIVLMTDGEMTGPSSNWDSSIDKKVRDICTAAKGDGIQIFTVAFMAPQKGKDLLSFCATSTSNAYQPDNMQKLVKDFGDIAAKATSSLTRLTN